VKNSSPQLYTGSPQPSPTHTLLRAPIVTWDTPSFARVLAARTSTHVQTHYQGGLLTEEGNSSLPVLPGSLSAC
jgi:hypothetical protein